MTIHQSLLDHITRLYGLAASQLIPLSGGHFAHVYEYTCNQRPCILKITPPSREVDVQSTRAMLEWLAFLAQHDGPVTVPIRSLGGNLIEPVRNENRLYIASAFEKAPGVLAEGISPAEWSDELFQALGRTLGQCHKVAEAYVPASEALRRPEWDVAGSCFNPNEALAHADGAILAQRARVLKLIQALPKDRDNYGLAHLDLHFGNFFVDMERRHIVLFDFDDCAYGWYLMDIAMLLFDVLVVYAGLDRTRFGAHFLEHLLKGYHLQKPISQFWISQLPHFLKLLEIGVYVMLFRSYDPATADEWVSKFMPGRQQRIEQGVPYVDLDFEAIYRRATA